jgi:hypothetical protein
MRFIGTVVLVLFMIVLNLQAQTGAGRIQGAITDATGAALPGAAVSLENLATAAVAKTESNAAGLFLYPGLGAGEYRLSVSLPGMLPWSGKLTLYTGQVAEVPVSLSVAGTRTEVTVTSEVTQLVTTESATLSGTIENKRLAELPLNGRFIQSVIMASVPGLENSAARARVWGLREGAMEWVQDGAVVNSRSTAELLRAPGMDSISEVKVETNASSAKFSRPGATILSTKSGTNEFHGSAFHTMRNSSFGVARRRQDFFDKAPKYIRNEPGVSAGGPVVLPRLYNGRNRTFVFGAWESMIRRENLTRNVRLPTAGLREGDYAGFTAANGQAITIYDPYTTAGREANWTRTPFPNNRIPSARRSPLAQTYYGLLPLPTMPEINPLVSANFFRGYSAINDQQKFATRVDHRFSSRDNFFFRFNRVSEHQDEPTSNVPMLEGGVAHREIEDTVSKNFAGNWVRTMSPTLFVETSVSWSRLTLDDDLDNPAMSADFASAWGLPNPKGMKGMPDLRNVGFENNLNAAYLFARHDTILQASQNFTHMRGRHQLEFGWHHRRDNVVTIPNQSPTQVEVSFNSGATALYDPRTGTSIGATQNTGHDSANFYLGVAGSYTARLKRRSFENNTREWAGYIQDNWKVRPNFTLNAGLRWDYLSPYSEANGEMIGFDIPTRSIVLGVTTDELIRRGGTTPATVAFYRRLGADFKTPQQVGLPEGFIYRNWRDFAPRAGAAYQTRLFGRPLVIRGGYGLYHFPLPIKTFNNPMQDAQPYNATFQNNINSSQFTPDGLPNYGMRSAPTIVAGRNSAQAVSLASEPTGISRGFTIYRMDPHQPSALAREWNFTLESEIMDRTVLRLGYVGASGRNNELWEGQNISVNNYLWMLRTGTEPPTGEYGNVARRSLDRTTFGEMRTYLRGAYSNFHALQAQFERRYSAGLAYQVFYVFSRALSTGFAPSSGGYASDNEILLEPWAFAPGAVPEDRDARLKFLTYRTDDEIAPHRVRWNFLYDLPVGRGKRLLGNAGRALNLIAGGWQASSMGQWSSRLNALPTGNWGAIRDIKVYGLNNKIQDCRSGVCYDGYLFYNGYIPANRVNSYDPKTGLPNGVMGVPKDYYPAHQPVNPIAATGGAGDHNRVPVTLKDGRVVETNLDTNLHPWRTAYLRVPGQFTLDASLFKAFRINERISIRLNLDAFNVLNNPSLVRPDMNTGILTLRDSGVGARQLQATLRLNW